MRPRCDYLGVRAGEGHFKVRLTASQAMPADAIAASLAAPDMARAGSAMRSAEEVDLQDVSPGRAVAAARRMAVRRRSLVGARQSCPTAAAA